MEALMSEPLADRLANYSCQLRYEDLPGPVVHEVKRRFIDSFATAVGAMDADAFAIAKSDRQANGMHFSSGHSSNRCHRAPR